MVIVIESRFLTTGYTNPLQNISSHTGAIKIVSNMTMAKAKLVVTNCEVNEWAVESLGIDTLKITAIETPINIYNKKLTGLKGIRLSAVLIGSLYLFFITYIIEKNNVSDEKTVYPTIRYGLR